MESRSSWLAASVLAVLLCFAGCTSQPENQDPSSPASEPSRSVRVAIVHFTPRLGDVRGNIVAGQGAVARALDSGAHLVVLPELATTGYSVTAEDLRAGSALMAPFPELEAIASLARSHGAYVYVGLAEMESSGKLYNSAVVFGPHGLEDVIRKRGVAVWNERGNIPFEVIATPFGDIGTVICSDTYLPDVSRIVTLQGADILVAPANWWGDPSAIDVWRVRAKENGIWVVVANRGGRETDRRFDPPFEYDMRDAPSVVIDPTGSVRLSHRESEKSIGDEQILYFSIEVAKGRAQSTWNPTTTVQNREPGAYGAIRSAGDGSTAPGSPARDLPPAGVTSVAALAYTPDETIARNIETIRSRLGNLKAEVVALPGLGLVAATLDPGDPNWVTKAGIDAVRSILREHQVRLALTTVRVTRDGALPVEELLVLEEASPVRLVPQIHLEGDAVGRLEVLDLPHARVALMTGRDLAYPELPTVLARSGVDLVIVSSRLASSAAGEGERWDADLLMSGWAVSTNSGFHLAGADATGRAMLVKNGGGGVEDKRIMGASSEVSTFELDSGPVRQRRLNELHPFDVEVLLRKGGSASASAPTVP